MLCPEVKLIPPHVSLQADACLYLVVLLDVSAPEPSSLPLENTLKRSLLLALRCVNACRIELRLEGTAWVH